MQEIADKLESKLIHAQELKDFLSNICCEQYSNLSAHVANLPYLEKEWPTYAEDTESPHNGGDFRLGRLPSFLYKDLDTLDNAITDGMCIAQGGKDDDNAQGGKYDTRSNAKVDNDSSRIRSATYQSMFTGAFQFFQERCQYHIHKEIHGKRVVPVTCRSKTNPKECKHGFPCSNRLNTLEPLLICQGLAKRFKLRCSGARNWLGQILGLRNDEWVNGTMPAICVAFAGSNSDVKPNDRLPILAHTHEQTCGKKTCVKKHSIKRTARLAQRAQSVSNGYFGGYIGKRQPAGKLEVKKCMDKMHRLRDKIRSHSHHSQVRAASGRLMTELEMNSTYRGAVEIFNLCRHLRTSDVLSAECIRTFGTCSINGAQFMYRLTQLQSVKTFGEASLQSYVPPMKKSNVRSRNSRPVDVEIYGLRPLVFPWEFLSPFEFFRYWKAEALLVPTYYSNNGHPARTQWTSEGQRLIQSDAYRNEQIAAKPGLHYTVIPCANESYTVFPAEPAHMYDTLRHAWVLVRKSPPDVVMIEQYKKPGPSSSAADAAKYGCVFFRPWTLLSGHCHVPHFSLLCLNTKNLEAFYSDAAMNLSMTSCVQWYSAWEEYVRGHVVTDTAATHI